MLSMNFINFKVNLYNLILNYHYPSLILHIQFLILNRTRGESRTLDLRLMSPAL